MSILGYNHFIHPGLKAGTADIIIEENKYLGVLNPGTGDISVLTK